MTQPTDAHVTDTPVHGPHAGEHAPVVPFTAQEMEFFHRDDRAAAKAVVLLVTGIFGIGIFLYLFVDWVVSSSP